MTSMNFTDIEELEQEFQSGNLPPLLVLSGRIPVLVSAPHAVTHWRDGREKNADLYTGALALWLHEQTGCAVLAAGRPSQADGNHDPAAVSPYKQELARILRENPVKVVLDLHGAKASQPFDVELGTGPGWEGKSALVQEARLCFLAQGFHPKKIWSDRLFSAAKTETVTRFCIQDLKVPALQLEINRKYRDPGKPENLEMLMAALKDLVISCA